MPLRARPEIEKLKTSHHGGINYAELKAAGIAPESVSDFSVCSNPFMPPPGIRKLLPTVSIERYPDTEATELRQHIAKRLSVMPDNILVGNGSTELIRLIALTYFRPGDSILIIDPTFGEYEVAARIAGANPVKQLLTPENNFTIKIEETIDLIREHHPRAVFICNPNNPTGQYLPRPDVERLLANIGDGLLVLDEAYVTFLEKSWSSIGLVPQGNIVILRSMTKDYGLAGVRLGYALAQEGIIANLCRVRPPWNVNAFAQAIGVVALQARVSLEQSQKKIRALKNYLVDGMRRLNFQPLPSDANFFLVKVGHGELFRAALLKHGILVRDCASFGLPEYVRIAPRTMPECRKLIETIQVLRKKGEI